MDYKHTKTIQRGGIPPFYIDPVSLVFHENFEEILRDTQNFGNLKNYSRSVDFIGDYSNNGFLRKFKYTSDKYEVDVIQKNNKTLKSDSLVYEYLVGQCINHFAQFYPCFSLTYQIFKYRSDMDYRIMEYFLLKRKSDDYDPDLDEKVKQITLSTGLDQMLSALDEKDIVKLIKTGCENNDKMCIMTQYLPFESSLSKYIISRNMNPNTLTTILYMVYACLASFSNVFTHYDLHTNNVQLVRIPNDGYSIIRVNNKDGSVISYKTDYIPVIIDYGRCFVDCDKLNSTELYKTVCQYDRDNVVPSERSCLNDCGDLSGYQFAPKYYRLKQSFIPNGKDDYYIDPTRRNMSHDLNLINILQKYQEGINFSPALKSFFKKLVIPETSYGQSEKLGTNPYGKIQNVISAKDELSDIINTADFIDENNEIFKDKQYYNTIDIWSDLSKPFEVSYTDESQPEINFYGEIRNV